MRGKGSVIFLSAISVILFILLIIWAGINFIIIPGLIVPKIHEYIEENISGDVKLDVRDISFHPIKGFLFRGLVLKGPVGLKDNYILQADLVDIDLAFLPLLLKRIEVLLFKMSGVDLNIGRNSKGEWNFKPLFDLDFMSDEDKNKGNAGFKFTIKRLRIEDCFIDYTDYMKKDNMLERKIANVELDITNPGAQLYKLNLSGGAADRSKESFDLMIRYNKLKDSASGSVKFNTSFVGEYWDYYLDEILEPWRLQADNIGIVMDFSLDGDALSLNGQYNVDNGILNYGDLSIKGDALARQKLEYLRGDPQKGNDRIDLTLENVSSFSGQYVFITKGKCTAVITERDITIKELSSIAKRHLISYTGNFSFTDPKELRLSGMIADVKNSFSLKLTEDNKGTMDWEGGIGDSNFRFSADISDLKDMAFNLNTDGTINLPDISELLMVDEKDITGKINFSGSITGELDEISLLKGNVTIGLEDFSLFDVEVESFDVAMNIKDGVLKGDIPKRDFYKGFFYGAVLMDFNRWGLEFHLDNFDIEEFSKTNAKLQGIKGVFTGSVAYVSKWTELSSMNGGGYVKITNCDPWSSPLFAKTEEGLESVTADIEMPVIKEIEGNFGIKDESINIEHAFCKSKNLNLSITGNYSFSGKADFTVGVRLLGEDLFRTARHILLPATIGIDMIANCIKVKITGQWPDLAQKTELQPMGWLTVFFPTSDRAKPDKYTLDKLWSSAA